MKYLVKNRCCVGKNNNYLLAGNLCNAFAIGDIGSQDDFFLVGSEPDGESSYPLLTGNFLDSEGNVLFRLVRNVLLVNPGNCSRIAGDLCAYEIHDSAGKPIFSVKTVFERPPVLTDGPLPSSVKEMLAIGADADVIPPPSITASNLTEEMFLTTITGTFYNRDGKAVFRANSGEPDECIETDAKFLIGFPGGMVHGYTEEELRFVNEVVATHGRIQRPLLGEIQNQEIRLDGAALIDAKVTNCTVHVHSGDFAILGRLRFEGCRFVFHDQAERIRQLVLTLEHPLKPQGKGTCG